MDVREQLLRRVYKPTVVTLAKGTPEELVIQAVILRLDALAFAALFQMVFPGLPTSKMAAAIQDDSTAGKLRTAELMSKVICATFFIAAVEGGVPIAGPKLFDEITIMATSLEDRRALFDETMSWCGYTEEAQAAADLFRDAPATDAGAGADSGDVREGAVGISAGQSA
jgi:hypothetical protein